MQDLAKYKSVLKLLEPYLTSVKDRKRISTQLLLSQEVLEKRIKSFSDKSGVRMDLLEKAAEAEIIECDDNWVRSW